MRWLATNRQLRAHIERQDARAERDRAEARRSAAAQDRKIAELSRAIVERDYVIAELKSDRSDRVSEQITRTFADSYRLEAALVEGREDRDRLEALLAERDAEIANLHLEVANLLAEVPS